MDAAVGNICIYLAYTEFSSLAIQSHFQLLEVLPYEPIYSSCHFRHILAVIAFGRNGKNWKSQKLTELVKITIRQGIPKTYSHGRLFHYHSFPTAYYSYFIIIIPYNQQNVNMQNVQNVCSIIVHNNGTFVHKLFTKNSQKNIDLFIINSLLRGHFQRFPKLAVRIS